MDRSKFKTAINLLNSIETKDPNTTYTLKKVIQRILKIREKYIEIEKINNNLLKANDDLNQMRNEFPSTEDILNLLWIQKDSDPQLQDWFKNHPGPLLVSKPVVTEIVPLLPEEITESPYAQSKLLTNLQIDTENIYIELWLIITELQEITIFNNFKPLGVTNVRNHLIQHTKGKGSMALINSFGIHTNGPILKPIRPKDSPAPIDKGLYPNLEEFLDQIIKLLSPTANSVLQSTHKD